MKALAGASQTNPNITSVKTSPLYNMPFSSKSNISVVKSERKTFASDGLEGP
jgi:hypothetical protein